MAKNINAIPVNGKRSNLANSIPLSTPYKIDIFPIYACNFRCGYCIHSVPMNSRGDICNNKIMPLDMIRDLTKVKFTEKIKVIHFAGYGEPLLHPDIVEMVKIVVDSSIANVVDIVTNGALLSRDLSKKLMEAGLGKLRISLQGLDREMYKRVSDVDLDFEQFKKNIYEFKEMRDKYNYQTEIYIKILDSVLGNYSEEDFYEKFSPLCDYIAIEHLEPLVDEISYEDKFNKTKFDTNVKGNKVNSLKVCPCPFYSMMINPDGDVLPCCNHYKPIVLGNICEDSIVDIWNSDKLKEFQKQQLMYSRGGVDVCYRCNTIKYQSFPEDNIDDYAPEILKRYK